MMHLPIIFGFIISGLFTSGLIPSCHIIRGDMTTGVKLS